jgi:hypothetical protein
MADDEPNFWRPTTPPGARHDTDSDQPEQDENLEAQGLLDREEQWDELQYTRDRTGPQMPLPDRRVFLMRVLALLCACSLSVGSH